MVDTFLVARDPIDTSTPERQADIEGMAAPANFEKAIGSLAGQTTESVKGFVDRQWHDNLQRPIKSIFGSEGVMRPNVPQPPEKMLSPEEANKIHGMPDGHKFTAPVSEYSAQSIADAVRKRQAAEMVWSRYANAHSMPINMATGLIGSMLDPIDAATMLVPGIGEERLTYALAKAGMGAKASIVTGKAGAGATAAMAGTAATIPIRSFANHDELYDYTVHDALTELLYSAPFGAMMHAGISPMLGAGAALVKGVKPEPYFHDYYWPTSEMTPDKMTRESQLGAQFGAAKGYAEFESKNVPISFGHIDELSNLNAIDKNIWQRSNVAQIYTEREPNAGQFLFPNHSSEARKLAPEAHEEWDRLQAEHDQLAAEHLWGAKPTLEQLNDPAWHLEQELREHVKDILPVSLDLRVAAEGIDTAPAEAPLIVAQGMTDPATRTAWVSAMAVDPKLVAREESGHAIRASGLFKREEWGILRDAAINDGWIDDMPKAVQERYHEAYADRGPDGARDAMVEEAIMHRFAKGPEAWGPQGGPISRFMYRIKQLLDRVGNWMTSRGFQSASDIFDAMESGKISARDTMPPHISRRANDIEARMNELKPTILDAYRQAKEISVADLPSIASMQRSQARWGAAHAMTQKDLEKTLQEIYGPKEQSQVAPTKSGDIPLELQMQERRLQDLVAEGYKPMEDEIAEHKQTQQALQEALLHEQGYMQAAECLIISGI